MKKIFTPEALVGLFALIGLVIVIFMSLEVSESNIARGKSKKYYALFDSVTGVVDKSPVETAGIRVGYIDGIKLEKTKAKVTVKIIPDLVLYENAALFVKDRGILGDRYLLLDIGTSNHPVLKEGSRIKNSFHQSDLERLTSYLADAADNIKKITKVLGEEAEKGSFNEIIDDIKGLVGNLNEIVQDNRRGINEIVDNMRSVTTTIKEALGDGDRMKNAVTKLEQALDSLSKIAKKIDKGEGTIGKLVSDEKTAKKFESTLDGINDYIESAKRLQTEFGYRGEYLTDSKSIQHAVEIKIKPKPDKYIKFEMIDAVRGKETITESTVTVPPNDTVVAQSKTVETTDNFQFSLELAKRFYDFNVHFGIIRSSGGAGFDYYFLNDLLQFSFEAFDFSRFDNRPRIRTFATLHLYKYFLLTGGVDDLIDRGGNRDFFFGAGFTFTDNDIKTILSSIKIPGL